MEKMRKSMFHAEAKSAFYGELFFEQCREYLRFKVFNKVMPRFNIPLETQASGASQSKGRTQVSPNSDTEPNGRSDHHRLTPNNL